MSPLMMTIFLAIVSAISYILSVYASTRLHYHFQLLDFDRLLSLSQFLGSNTGQISSVCLIVAYFLVAKLISVRWGRWLGWLSGLWIGYLALHLVYGGFFHICEYLFIYISPNAEESIHFWTAYLSLIIIHTSLLYGLWNSARVPLLKEIKVIDQEVGKDLHGYQILQMSDVHIGPTLGRKFIRSLEQICSTVEPDLIVMTGDLVDGEVKYLADEVRLFLNLARYARQGMFLITGNHEYISGAESWVHFIKSQGGDVLENEHRLLEIGDRTLAVIGVEDWDAKKFDPHRHPSLSKAMEGLPDSCYKLLLAHQPKAAPQAADNGIHLQLSGHTHAGQIFPFNFLIYLDQPYNVGRYCLDQMTLYVSPGTGYWGPPLRIGTRAEVTLLTLISTDDKQPILNE